MHTGRVHRSELGLRVFVHQKHPPRFLRGHSRPHDFVSCVCRISVLKGSLALSAGRLTVVDNYYSAMFRCTM